MVGYRPLACAVALAATFGSGCTAPWATAKPEAAPAHAADAKTSALERRCIGYLRDVRRWCRADLANDPRAQRYQCLDARMKLDQECF